MKQTWYGTSSFCQKLGVLYSDNSMDKYLNTKKLAQRNSNKLLADYKKVNSDLSLHKDINSRVDLYSKELSSYFASVSQLENEQITMSIAAVFIQKYIRGYLARIKFTPLLIEVHKRLNNKQVQDLEADSLYCMYNFGKNLQIATKKIQKSVRNLLFRLKLKRFEQYYEEIMFQRDKIKLEKLISLSFVLFARFHLNHARFLRDRDRKLKKIKRKLTIIKIKQVMIREKIQLKNLKLGIRKYKRRITMGLVSSTKLDSEKTNEDENKSSNTEEEEKLARMKRMIEIEEAKRKRIKLGKISYKVPKLKYFKLQSRIKRDNSRSSSSDSASPEVNAKTEAVPRCTPEPVVVKRFNKYKDVKSNYMNATESFKFALKGPSWLMPTEQEKPRLKLGKLRETIYMPTQISGQKVKQKKQYFKGEKPTWSSNTMVPERYTPSIFSIDDRGFNAGKIIGESRDFEKKRENRKKTGTRTVFERRYVESNSFTPASNRFEEALPELSKFTKIYSKGKHISMSRNENKSMEYSSISLYPNC